MRTRTCAFNGVRNIRFFENLAYFLFLLPLCREIHPFLLLPSKYAVTNLHKLSFNSGCFLLIHNLLLVVLPFFLKWNFFKYTMAYLSGIVFCPINQNNKDVISVPQHVFLLIGIMIHFSFL